MSRYSAAMCQDPIIPHADLVEAANFAVLDAFVIEQGIDPAVGHEYKAPKAGRQEQGNTKIKDAEQEEEFESGGPILLYCMMGEVL
jgi:hypothetical protein